ncbi:MAG: DUF4867 family protein [Lachnospiraceae bacterium]|nr:DUF4867 family protein [Lachnospiraceae bacterium]
MKIQSIFDPEFKVYGQIVDGYDFSELLSRLEACAPIPEGISYVPDEPALQELPIAGLFSQNLFGGMPVQVGWVSGHNTKLNCLEYHRDSEYNLGTEDFILLVGKREQMEEDGTFDTSLVKAFRVPKGVMVEIFATTLHFCPCDSDPKKGFCCLALMSRGSNTEKPDIEPVSREDRLLYARNKWLLAHPDSFQAGDGAFVGLKGENIDLAD